MRSLFVVVLTAVLFFVPAVAHAQGESAPAPWGWLVLDADLAEQILAEGDASGAGQLALATHRALTTAVESVADARGQAFVDRLHRDLSRVLLASGFYVPAPPLQSLDGVAGVEGSP